MHVCSLDCGIEIRGEVSEKALVNDFARRYIPELEICRGESDATVVWENGRNCVEILEIQLGDEDTFRIRSAPPQPYINEHPYFFLLHVFSRLYEKRGYLLFTDTAVFSSQGKGVMLMGPPHTGKSTLMVLAIGHGFVPLSNENSVFEVRNGKLFFLGGATTLTFSSKVEKLLNVEKDGVTRSGYGMLDLRKFHRKRAKIEKIFYLNSSFRSRGFDKEEISGRKITKILWDHSSKIINGGEFYEEFPPNLSTPELSRTRAQKIKEIARVYRGKFLEVFGSHRGIFDGILEEMGWRG